MWVLLVIGAGPGLRALAFFMGFSSLPKGTQRITHPSAVPAPPARIPPDGDRPPHDGAVQLADHFDTAES